MRGTTLAGVILDFGGVLWDMGWEASRHLEEEHRLPRGCVFSTLYGSDAWAKLQCGMDVWREDAHRALEALAGRSLPRVHETWRASQGPLARNVDLVRALRPAYRLSVLSNADRTLRERLRDGLGIHDLFDDVVCSAEVGIAKPDPAIYAMACRRLGLPPGACVFVDDHDVNVRAAEAAGLMAVLHRADRGDDLGAQLAALGVRPPVAPA